MNAISLRVDAADITGRTLALTCEPLTELRVSPPGVSTSEAALASLEEGVPPGATAVMVAQ